MKYRSVRIALVVCEIFVGLGAIAGGIGLLTGEFAQSIPVSWLQGTPFLDYTIPGLTLAIVIGGGMVLAAAAIFLHRKWAVLLSAIAGIFMAGFEIVEAVSIDSKTGNGLPMAIGLQLCYLVLGSTIFGLATFLWMREYHGHPVSTTHVSRG